MPIIYVIAGPNGIGKTTLRYNLIPQNTPVINSDEIAKQTRAAGVTINIQEFSNREASKLVNEQIEKRNSFAFETNLCDSDTWNFLIELQKTGYQLNVFFISTNDLAILNKRIAERVQTGDHYVRPDVVKERYLKSLQLLKHNYQKPDVLYLLDNSKEITLMAKFQSGKVVFLAEKLPGWIKEYIIPQFTPQEKAKTIRDLKNIDEVRKAYRTLKDENSTKRESK
jgi:predicted ABC-type ATPase